MRKLGMKALIGLGLVVVSTTTLVSCGGGSSSSGGLGSSSSSTSSATNSDTPSKLEKNAYLTISIPALAERIQSQLLPEDVTKVVVTIYQYPQTSSDGIMCEEYQNCNITEEEVTLTPQNPTATVSLFPGFTKICISTVSNTFSSNVMCGIAVLKTGNNTLNYTLIRGTWSLPEGKDIAGFKKFAIKGMSQNYESAYYYDPSLNIIASSDGNTWSNIDGGYVQGDYDKGGKIFGFGKSDSSGNGYGFIALDGDPKGIKVLNIRYLYSYLYGYSYYSYAYVLEESESSFKIEDRNGQDVTNNLLETCKFESTDGKSIKGCIIKNAKKSTQQDYTYKLTHTSKRTGANICYDNRDRYDSASDVCYNYGYSYDYYNAVYRCYDSTYTYNSDKRRCEASLEKVCERSGGTYDANSKSCTETETEYYSVGSVERVTITGSGSLPSSGNINIQKK